VVKAHRLYLDIKRAIIDRTVITFAGKLSIRTRKRQELLQLKDQCQSYEANSDRITDV